jgi:hypothetical protein
VADTLTAVREWGLRSSTGMVAAWPSEDAARARADAYPHALTLVSRVPGGQWEVER